MLKSIILIAVVAAAAARPQNGQPPNAQGGPTGPAGPAGPTHPDAPHGAPGNASASTIVKSEFVDNGDGSFKWGFETSDGFKAEQTGETAPPGPARAGKALDGGAEGAGAEDEEGGGEIIKGSYSYNAPDGQVISVTYIADKNGFQPMGSHIPTSPPNPNAAAGAKAAPGGAPAAASAASAAGGGAGPPASAPASSPQDPNAQPQPQ